MELDWSSRTWIEKRNIGFQRFGSALAINMECVGWWDVAVQWREGWRKLDLHRTVAREERSPIHYAELFWEEA